MGAPWKERLLGIPHEPFPEPKKILVAVISHRGGFEKRRIVRETWMTIVDPSITVKFFVGDYEGDEPDVVSLDCDDSYVGFLDKVREIVRWAIANGYDFMWKIDDDVQLHPASFLSTQIGHVRPTVYKGWFYGLNVHAMAAVAAAAVPPVMFEEKWIGDISMDNRVPVVVFFEEGGQFFKEIKTDERAPYVGQGRPPSTFQAYNMPWQEYEPLAKARFEHIKTLGG
jgi:galactosyltransferase